MAHQPLLLRAARKVPGLRRIPVTQLIILGEVAMLARSHFERLNPDERRRFLSLMSRARGRRENLSSRDRADFEALTAKLEPRLFVGQVAERFSPVPLPRRVVHGSRRRRRP